MNLRSHRPPPDRRQRLPARHLPIRYYAFAHLCLAGAATTMLLAPQRVGGFYYHPSMLAVVHLVTLGWISCSILGSLYLIAPMALRVPFPAHRLDHWAQGLVLVGISGMASHFWLDEPSGMVWSAGMLTSGFVVVAIRFLRVLAGAPVPPAVKLHFRFAFGNLVLAATLGLLLGVDKTADLLPGYVLDNVAGHAHLAALGWATMTVMAAGYRLLPMFLPAAMPAGPGVWASALLLQAGVLGVAASLLWWHPGVGPAALLAAAGIVAFFLRLRWMLRHRRPAPRAMRQPDLAVVQVLAAFVYLGLAVLLGLVLAWAPAGAWKLRAILIYGVVGLLGFLAQIIAGVLFRLLPLFAWYQGFADHDFKTGPPSPLAMVRRPVHLVVIVGWTLAIPLLAVALAADLPLVLRGGGAMLLTAVLLGGWELARVLWRARRPGNGIPVKGPPTTPKSARGSGAC